MTQSAITAANHALAAASVYDGDILPAIIGGLLVIALGLTTLCPTRR